MGHLSKSFWPAFAVRTAYHFQKRTYSRVPNVGSFLPARFMGEVYHISLFPRKKSREFQKLTLSLSETTISWSNFGFLQKNVI